MITMCVIRKPVSLPILFISVLVSRYCQLVVEVKVPVYFLKSPGVCVTSTKGREVDGQGSEWTVSGCIGIKSNQCKFVMIISWDRTAHSYYAVCVCVCVCVFVCHPHVCTLVEIMADQIPDV